MLSLCSLPDRYVVHRCTLCITVFSDYFSVQLASHITAIQTAITLSLVLNLHLTTGQPTYS